MYNIWGGHFVFRIREVIYGILNLENVFLRNKKIINFQGELTKVSAAVVKLFIRK